MKLLICSDIHGDLDSIKKVLSAYEREKADRILILGDLLYHGPRNDLPDTYAPKEVIKLINENKNIIFSVRGNCDTEVDQMVLDLPILAEYMYLELDGIFVFATHGHIHNLESKPRLRPGEILLHGHTHVFANDDFGDGNVYLNPGSAALPKNGNPRTYMVYEERTFTLKELDGREIFSRKF